MDRRPNIFLCILTISHCLTLASACSQASEDQPQPGGEHGQAGRPGGGAPDQRGLHTGGLRGQSSQPQPDPGQRHRQEQHGQLGQQSAAAAAAVGPPASSDVPDVPRGAAGQQTLGETRELLSSS